MQFVVTCNNGLLLCSLSLLDVPSRNWDMLMAEKWPDHKDSTLSHGDNSDIDSYSDIEECSTPPLAPEGEEIDSDDIQDKTGVSPPLPPLAKGMESLSTGKTKPSASLAEARKKKQQYGKGMMKLHTSTPLQHHQQQRVGLLGIIIMYVHI